MKLRTPRLKLSKKNSCILLGLAACLSFGTFSARADIVLEDGVTPHKGIDALYEKLAAATASLNTESFSKIYAEDAFYLIPTAPLIQGIDGIKPDWDDWFVWMKEGNGSLDMDFRIVAREVHDDAIGYDIGYAKTLQKRPNEADVTYETKFVVVTKKLPNGEWRYQVDAYSQLKKDK
ncbi:hypothetical protein F9L33_11830 [Amylibacter sp. SFDW26]|uniref:YybH family protein n=1 Tax=Amylibacter sp. SFDW26 TaxID=2652722 RepID=UPI001261815B|nr:hypothetical protein [Amylibacter sp. SFDW26]KAB7613290.1 hypothetical protein F9L33_11830 [Amylibacter sp. SFDW26]